MEFLEPVLTIAVSVLASSGFWAYLSSRREKKDVKTKMLVGLGHDRITWLGMQYIDRGFIYQDEYENLYDYLYKPYEELGGNGSAKRVMNAVSALPIKANPKSV